MVDFHVSFWISLLTENWEWQPLHVPEIRDAQACFNIHSHPSKKNQKGNFFECKGLSLRVLSRYQWVQYHLQ